MCNIKVTGNQTNEVLGHCIDAEQTGDSKFTEIPCELASAAAYLIGGKQFTQLIEDLYELIDNNMVTAYNPVNGEFFDIGGVVLGESGIQINLISNGCKPQ